MYREWTQIEYQNKHYNIDQKDEGTWDDRGRDKRTNFILRVKEQEARLTLHEHDEDDKVCRISSILINRRRHPMVRLAEAHQYQP
jgi:hypothetical protein